jgi:hypothetical protein
VLTEKLDDKGARLEHTHRKSLKRLAQETGVPKSSARTATQLLKAMPQLKRLVAGFPPRWPGFASGQHVGFVVDKAALGQVFSKYFGSPANHSTNFSIIIITQGWHNRPISGRSANWTPPPTIPTQLLKPSSKNLCLVCCKCKKD